MNLVFLAGARDFHAVDWYRSALSLNGLTDVRFVTDLKSAEGFKNLVPDCESLIILDALLPKQSSKNSDKLRNLLKILFLPMQAILFRFKTDNTDVVYCHGMYYGLISRMAFRRYVITPQGSELLVRPKRSVLYKWLLLLSLNGADHVTMDSLSMITVAKSLGVHSKIHLIQNGIDIDAILKLKGCNNGSASASAGLGSFRGLTDLYNIEVIIEAVNRNNKIVSNFEFIFPFYDSEYLDKCKEIATPIISFLGRLERLEMYKWMMTKKLLISIPKSDSSPRSVYEAIFLNCLVVVHFNSYIDTLPSSMKSRLYIVNTFEQENWLKNAIKWAEHQPRFYKPCDEALEIFDQRNSMKKIINLY